MRAAGRAGTRGHDPDTPAPHPDRDPGFARPRTPRPAGGPDADRGGRFAVQGLALITGFLLYARERWAGLLRHDRIGDLPHSPTLTTQRAFACVAAPLAAGIAAARDRGGPGSRRPGIGERAATLRGGCEAGPADDGTTWRLTVWLPVGGEQG
ncbi:hypothetical protein ACFP3U_02150 [Kitasatospora misakiensis]|uniref:Uncharacterized protein n=1 Tax=Kitasatospora misakiensis TaxID=67330 RepID=A0ABW0WY46_9ACTN